MLGRVKMNVRWLGEVWDINNDREISAEYKAVIYGDQVASVEDDCIEVDIDEEASEMYRVKPDDGGTCVSTADENRIWEAMLEYAYEHEDEWEAV